MSKYTIRRYGTDSSGRPIYMTEYMHQWLENVLNRPRVRPFADKVTIVQGAWMAKAGGGASASAGYHDGGGCLDFRTWNLTTTEINHLIVAMRLEGAAAWRRDYAHGGMDPHIHITLGGDKGMTSGAQNSWWQYLNGYNGLASYGADYEWRPSPIRKFKYNGKPKKPKKPKINLTVLQNAWGRKRGKTFGKGQFIIRKFAKPLRKRGFLKHWHFRDATYGRNMRNAVRAANKHYGITKYTGKNGDRPTWALAKKLGFRPYKVEQKKKPKHKKPFVNRRRVNRALRNPNHKVGKLARRQMNRVVRALRKRGWSVKGYPKHTESLRRAIGNFQSNQGWTGDGANGLLGPTTCDRLGLRSKWTKLPSWRRVRPFKKSVSKTVK